MAAVTICSDIGAQEYKVCHCFHCFSIDFHEVTGPDAMILVFQMLSFKPAFSLSSFPFIKGLFNFSSFSAIRVFSVICISEVTDISPGNLDFSLCFIQPGILHDVFCIWRFTDGASGKKPTCQCRRHKKWGFDSWGRSSHGGDGNPPKYLPGEPHGQRSLSDYCP